MYNDEYNLIMATHETSRKYNMITGFAFNVKGQNVRLWVSVELLKKSPDFSVYYQFWKI